MISIIEAVAIGADVFVVLIATTMLIAELADTESGNALAWLLVLLIVIFGGGIQVYLALQS